MSEICFATYKHNVFNIYIIGPKTASHSAHCDLYRELFSIVSHFGLNLDDDRSDFVAYFDVSANNQANKEASLAIDKQQLPLPIAINYIYYVTLMAIIQKRFAAILMNLPQRQMNKRTNPHPRQADARPTNRALIYTNLHFSTPICINSTFHQ